MPTTDNVIYLSQQEIEQRAAEVRRANGLDSIPVDPVILAHQLGVSVYNAKFNEDSLVGMIAKRGDNVTILVNQADSPSRKRFTIAHELGHHFLHLQQDGEFLDEDANLFRTGDRPDAAVTPERRREIQANMFAAALLMPEAAVRTEWKQLHAIKPMARRFNVSEAAMGFRVAQLGLE